MHRLTVNVRALPALFAMMALAITAAASEAAKPHGSVPTIASAQGSVSIPGVTLARGASREQVMRDLAGRYTILKLKSKEGEEDSWLISEKDNADNYIGVVSFDEGRVRRVARFRKWTQDDDSVELAQRLFDLLEKLTTERGSQANIVARTTDSGTISVRGIELVFGDKRVSFTIISRNDANSKQTEVHLDEVVQ